MPTRTERNLDSRHEPTEEERRAVLDAGPGMLAVPTVDWMWTEAAQLIFGQHLPEGSATVVHRGAPGVDFKRNEFVRVFLARPHLRWIAFLDSDMTPPPDAVARLLATGKDIVAALCFGRYPPYHPMAGSDGKTVGSEIFDAEPPVEVEWAGTGLMVIRRHILEAIAEPWFKFVEFGTESGMGEDMYFCRKAAEHGFQLWLDHRVQPGHIGPVAVDAQYASYWAQANGRPAPATRESQEAREAAVSMPGGS